MPENDFSRLEKRVKALVSELKRLRGENRDMRRLLDDTEQERNLITQEREDIRRKVNGLLELVESLEEEEDDEND